MDHEDEFDAARGILTGAVLSLILAAAALLAVLGTLALINWRA